MLDYEKIFQESYQDWVEKEGDDGNGYRELCMAVESAFKAAGYDIPGDDLHRKYHNYIVDSVRRFETLSDVAKSFLGWIREPTDGNRSYAMSWMAKGEFPRWMFGRGPEYSPHYVTFQIEARLKEDKIRRGTKRYNALIEEKAKTVVESMIEGAKIAIEEWKTKAQKEAKALDQENKQGWDYMVNLLELVEVVKAFREVGGIPDYRPEIEGFLMAEYEVIKKGYESRVKSLDGILNADFDPVELVKEAASRNKDILPFWEAYKRQVG